MTKKQIKDIQKSLKAAILAEAAFEASKRKLKEAIVTATGIDGEVDHFRGDGFSFMPAWEMYEANTHVSVELIVESALDGVKIDEDFINDSLVF